MHVLLSSRCLCTYACVCQTYFRNRATTTAISKAYTCAAVSSIFLHNIYMHVLYLYVFTCVNAHNMYYCHLIVF